MSFDFKNPWGKSGVYHTEWNESFKKVFSGARVDSLSKSSYTLQDQLTQIAGIEDSFYFDKSIQQGEGLSFKNAREFQAFLSNKSRADGMSTTSEGALKTAVFKFNLIFVGGIIIYVKQQITPYEILDVASSEWGVTTGFSWNQTTSDYNIVGNMAIVNIYGFLCYNIFIEGIGTVYKAAKQFQVTLNKTNGEAVSMKEIK